MAVDAAAILKNHGPINAGPLAEYGLESFQFFSFGYNANESMAEHLFAGLLYGRDNTKTIVCTLKTIYHAPAGWGGNETLGAAIMVRFMKY